MQALNRKWDIFPDYTSGKITIGYVNLNNLVQLVFELDIEDMAIAQHIVALHNEGI